MKFFLLFLTGVAIFSSIFLFLLAGVIIWESSDASISGFIIRHNTIIYGSRSYCGPRSKLFVQIVN